MFKSAAISNLIEYHFAYTEGVSLTQALVQLLSKWQHHLDVKINIGIQALFVDYTKAVDIMNAATCDALCSPTSL